MSWGLGRNPQVSGSLQVTVLKKKKKSCETPVPHLSLCLCISKMNFPLLHIQNVSRWSVWKLDGDVWKDVVGGVILTTRRAHGCECRCVQIDAQCMCGCRALGVQCGCASVE